jgi:hypothetical protein
MQVVVMQHVRAEEGTATTTSHRRDSDSVQTESIAHTHAQPRFLPVKGIGALSDGVLE